MSNKPDLYIALTEVPGNAVQNGGFLSASFQFVSLFNQLYCRMIGSTTENATADVKRLADERLLAEASIDFHVS
jgi:hypothetical protein